MFLLAALTLGLLGSLHCIGMCGPIALALPLKSKSWWGKMTGTLLYNSGRIVTYAIIGLLFGTIGRGFVLAGYQRTLSISLGILILVSLLLPYLPFPSIKSGFIAKPFLWVKSHLQSLFGIHSFKSLFLIGLLNGLLPCGLVYVAISGAVATGDTFKGSLFMAVFGAGTLPAMATLSIIKDLFHVRFRENIRRLVPVFVGTMALLLILRGLGLGIPYLSPSLKSGSGNCCHHSCHK